MAQFMRVKARKVRVGDYLAYGDWDGWLVAAIGHRSGEILIYARHGRVEDELTANPDQPVDIWRD
jgi:hypothetical protein